MLQFPILPQPDQYQELFQRIAILAQALQHIPLEQQTKRNIFHRQLLRSSLFSARIEGNQLTLASAQNIGDTPQEKQKLEISNVLKALKKITTYPEVVSLSTLLAVHAQVMHSLDARAGKLRTEDSAIFDQFGTVVYLTPSLPDMQSMLDELFEQCNGQHGASWQSQLLKVAACHYYFEKIHPFLDGNGRTGRVLMHYQLYRTQVFADFLLPIDQFFDEHRSQYYHLLEKNTRQIEGFLQFFLEGLVWSLESYLEEIKASPIETPAKTAGLLPRRQEIYLILKDHPFSSLDTIARRFPTIPRRTIAYDVQQLVKAEFVVKHGSTRGVSYSIKE